MYHFGNELLSNDPPSKDNPYKSFFTQIASARPIRGLNYRTPIMRISMDWNAVKISSETEVLFSKEVVNESEDYIDAPWTPTHEVETKYSHQFALNSKQEVRGTEFAVDRIDPLAIAIENGPDVYTGEEYTYQLTNPFTFKDETEALRIVRHTKVMKLPPRASEMQGCATLAELKAIILPEHASEMLGWETFGKLKAIILPEYGSKITPFGSYRP